LLSRIEFPDKNLEEWTMGLRLFWNLEPKITESNAEMLVPWTHELVIYGLLEECDRVYY
jgi:hypothetical protein